MPDILVTVEVIRLPNGSCEASAYPGDGAVRTIGSADEIEDRFIENWNLERGTDFAPENFQFVQLM